MLFTMLRALLVRVRVPVITGSFFLVFFISDFVSASTPRLFRVGGLPEGQNQYWCAAPTTAGWAAGTSDGILVQDGKSWVVVRPPTPGYVRMVTPYAQGLVVVGESFLFLYSQGRWTEIKSDEPFHAALSSKGTALLASSRSVCAITDRGEFVTLRRFTGNLRVTLHQLDDRVYVLPSNGSPLVWDGKALGDATKEFPWAVRTDSSQLEVVSLQKLEDGSVLAGTGRGFFVARDNQWEPILAATRREHIAEGIIGAHRFGDALVTLTFAGGVRVFSSHTGQLMWHATVDEYGGIYFSRYADGGLLIGTSTGLFVLPDPSRYAFTPLPVGDFGFVGTTAAGPIVCLTTGAVDLTGTKIPTPARLLSSLVLKDGRQVWGAVGRLTIGEKAYPWPGNGIFGLTQHSDGTLVVLQKNELGFCDINDGHVIRATSLTGPTANSLAQMSDGGYLVGTADGVVSFASDGAPLSRWGNRWMRVKTLAGRAIALDSQGNVFTEAGQRLISFPSTQILDVEQWGGATWVLANFPDNTTWLGQWNFQKNQWVPYEAPVGKKAYAIIAGKEALSVVCSDCIVEIKNPQPALQPPLVPQLGTDHDIPTLVSSHLGQDIDSVRLLLPAPRLGPWGNPSYRVRIDEGSWDTIGSASTARLTRLGRGASSVQVERTFAGSSDATTLRLVRDWPWWGTWPALLLYLGAGSGVVYGTIRWRTRFLQRRAEMLERQVEERTAELKKAQKAREDFFSTISHEIRNPLNGVVGICDILGHLDDEDPRRTRRHVKTLRGCADQLRTILDDVLDFSRIDRGEVQIYDEVFELTSAIDGAARSVDPGLEKTIVNLPVREIWVHGDQGKIRQIVTNLVSNALKYGIPPGAQVFAEAVESPGAPVQVTVRVRNTGVTLKPQEIDRIFSEFVRGQDALRRRIPGSGLGLAVSKRMAEAMKGSLTATSENGLTEFKLTLTLSVGEATEENPPPVDAPFELSRALAIEDEEYNRTVLGFHLAQLGYQVDWAKDGASALQWVRESGYDLILTDFMLPDTTGDELARKLLQLLPDPKPPIIAVTAYSTPDKIAQAKAAGISGFVTKPVSQKKLRAAILGATTNIDIRAPIKQDPAIHCDFTVFDRMDDGRRLLAEYAEGLLADWDGIAKECLGNLGERPMLHAVHTFKSRVLVAHATEVAEQLGLLEDAVMDKRESDVTRLLAIIRPMVVELAERAKQTAFR